MSTVDWSQWPNLSADQQNALRQAYRDAIRREHASLNSPLGRARLEYALTTGRSPDECHALRRNGREL
jgi:hypothetical protein